MFRSWCHPPENCRNLNIATILILNNCCHISDQYPRRKQRRSERLLLEIWSRGPQPVSLHRYRDLSWLYAAVWRSSEPLASSNRQSPIRNCRQVHSSNQQWGPCNRRNINQLLRSQQQEHYSSEFFGVGVADELPLPVGSFAKNFGDFRFAGAESLHGGT